MVRFFKTCTWRRQEPKTASELWFRNIYQLVCKKLAYFYWCFSNLANHAVLVSNKSPLNTHL